MLGGHLREEAKIGTDGSSGVAFEGWKANDRPTLGLERSFSKPQGSVNIILDEVTED